ncbi:MAG: glycosyltransferase [Gammaproteobacteria bacterium]|nr:glycosyltransferase [Gammaproteobacteria bacterium]
MTGSETAPASKVLEVCPYEPPASGWVNRVKLLRRIIREGRGQCEVLDVGPSRTIPDRDCIPVYGAIDYLTKVYRHVREGFIVHGHINAEYFRGLLLNLAALLIAKLMGVRALVTFHAGPVQPFLQGWRRVVFKPLFSLIFLVSDAVICNSEAEKNVLISYTRPEKVHPIPAFSAQYLEFEEIEMPADLQRFLQQCEPVMTSYLCFRDGFYTDVVIEAMQILRQSHLPNCGLVIVGTGDEEPEFRAELRRKDLEDAVFLTGNLDHDSFLTVLTSSALYLRTHVRDGVSSSVLESLALGVPVVAAENGTRPEFVVTFTASDADSMVTAILSTLNELEDIKSAIGRPALTDTAVQEVELILGQMSSSQQAALS